MSNDSKDKTPQSPVKQRDAAIGLALAAGTMDMTGYAAFLRENVSRDG